MNHQLLTAAFICVCSLVAPAMTLADGGTVRAIKKDGGFLISVFTSPVALAAGDVDISVLVQVADSMTTLPEAEVQVTLTPRERSYLAERQEARADLATNRLMKACHVQLEPSWYDVKVFVNNQEARGQAEFAMLVGPVPTKAMSFWPWFSWPAIPIGLVVANLAYRRMRWRVQMRGRSAASIAER